MNWKTLPGYEGYYEVNSAGQIRSVERYLGRQKRPSKILSPYKHGKYWRVDLYKDGKRSRIKVHTAVLRAFRGPCPKNKQARHLNDIKSDNRLCNLKYGTWAQNHLDAIRNERRPF